jgi:hypothetical protein
MICKINCSVIFIVILLWEQTVKGKDLSFFLYEAGCPGEIGGRTSN